MGQFDCGGPEGWQTSESGRIFWGLNFPAQDQGSLIEDGESHLELPAARGAAHQSLVWWRSQRKPNVYAPQAPPRLQLARQVIIDIATGQVTERDPDAGKNAGAVVRKGGEARARLLKPAERGGR